MTIDEIFSQLGAHMVEGLMIHSQMSDYFGFLGLKGYQECHKYHYFEENANYRRLNTDLYHNKNNSNRDENNDKVDLLRSDKNISTKSKEEMNYINNTIEGKNSNKDSKKIKSQ